MTRPDPTDPADDLFRDRVDAYCANLITADDFRALEAELLESDSARRYFAEYLQLHAELGFATRAGRAASVALSRFEGAEGTTGRATSARTRAGDQPRRRVRLRRLVLGELPPRSGWSGSGGLSSPGGEG